MDYEQLRQSYRPQQIKWLLVAESPPPAADKTSTRHFYRPTAAGDGDRLFNNTIRAIYPEAPEPLELVAHKEEWLQRFKTDDFYLIEALTESLPHGTKTKDRLEALHDAVPNLIKRTKQLAGPDTKIILIKSTTFKMCTEPLREAGLNVINTETLNYPGFWQEEPYRTKLKQLISS